MDAVLVRIDADRQLALVLGRLIDAESAGPRGCEDDIDAAAELGPRQLGAACRI
jgi:hypothetical protein